MQSCTDTQKLWIRAAWHLTNKGPVIWLSCRLKNLRNGFLIFFVEIYKQLTGDLRDVLNSLKSSTIDSIPQNVEETWYDDQENNEEQFQIGEAVASI